LAVLLGWNIDPFQFGVISSSNSWIFPSSLFRFKINSEKQQKDAFEIWQYCLEFVSAYLILVHFVLQFHEAKTSWPVSI
jgi:SNF family Na+-dependent transporter